MTKHNLLPIDMYVVLNKTILTDIDQKVLIMLYQPMIGANAVSLYLSLWSDLDKSLILSNKHSHYQIADKMGISILEFIESRSKLEALGLIKSYYRGGSVGEYIYTLYSPLSANEFFDNPLLNTLLYNTIGKDEYNKTLSYYQIPTFNLNEYEDVSCSFNDVFTSSSSLINNDSNVRKVNKNFIKLDDKINIDELIDMIPSDMVNYKKIDDKTKELIKSLVFVYNFESDELINIIKNSINVKKEIDTNELLKNARNYYGFENGNDKTKLINKAQPEALRKEVSNTSKKSRLIYQFENTTPYDFLASKYDGVKPTKTDISILEYLLVEMKLKAGVVNVLVDYVLKINNNKLTKNYIVAIASQWKKSRIETVNDAINMAHTEYNNKRVTKVTKEIKKPEWFDQKIDVKKPSVEKQKEMEELLKEFR